jgi:prephenate dehydrogenase
MQTTREVFSEHPPLYFSIQALNTHREELYERLTQSLQEITSLVLGDDEQGFSNLMHKGAAYFQS